MRIVFVSHNFSPDIHTPEDWFRRIKIYSGALTCLSEQHAVTRIERINYSGSCLNEGIQYHFVDYGNRKLYIPWRMHRFVKSLKPDVVVVHGLHYPAQTIQLRFHLGKKVKIFVQNHAERPFTGLKKYLQRLADQFINGYFFASKAMGEDWVKKGNISNANKIHEVMEVSSVFYQIDSATAISETGADGDPVFLWVGRLDQNKNPLLVVRSFLQFTISRPGASLYMIYQTTELLQAIEQLLDQEEYKGKRIFMVGKQPHDRLLYWYNSADFIVSGSFYEGSGTSVCEAMSCGCIPLVTNIFSFQTITDSGRCGILYEAGNEQSLLLAMSRAVHLDLALERRKTLEQFHHMLSFEAIANSIQRAILSG
jgi:glycosyltransferase involved in cell wall biosynthesis